MYKIQVNVKSFDGHNNFSYKKLPYTTALTTEITTEIYP